MSFLIGWALEGESAKPDTGDLVGGLISVAGALVIVFWPRR
jgi:drug/metabolite transporter superfamily protein YnfA